MLGEIVDIAEPVLVSESELSQTQFENVSSFLEPFSSLPLLPLVGHIDDVVSSVQENLETLKFMDAHLVDIAAASMIKGVVHPRYVEFSDALQSSAETYNEKIIPLIEYAESFFATPGITTLLAHMRDILFKRKSHLSFKVGPKALEEEKAKKKRVRSKKKNPGIVN